MGTLIIQPSTIDNYLTSFGPDSNRGSLTSININSRSTVIERGLLKFDFSAIPEPDNTTIDSAILSLFYVARTLDPVGRTYWAYRLTEIGWTELGSTWNDYDGVNNWATAGGDFTTTDGASAVVPASLDTWMNWTVTDQVQYALDNTNSIAHFLIKDGTETTPANKRALFYSREKVGFDAFRPKLVITFTTIVDFEGTPRKKTNSLTVQFTDKSNNSPVAWSWKRRPSGISAPYVEFSTVENPVEVFDIEVP